MVNESPVSGESVKEKAAAFLITRGMTFLDEHRKSGQSYSNFSLNVARSAS